MPKSEVKIAAVAYGSELPPEFRFLFFEFRSDFGFRISDFLHGLLEFGV